jgi:DNA-binding transcriptional ArsR family regulator
MPKSPGPLPLPRAARLFRVLGDPARLPRLLALAGAPELSVTELSEVVGQGCSGASQHLRLLRLAGFVACRRDGTRRRYRLASEHACHLLRWCAEGPCQGGPTGARVDPPARCC